MWKLFSRLRRRPAKTNTSHEHRVDLDSDDDLSQEVADALDDFPAKNRFLEQALVVAQCCSGVVDVQTGEDELSLRLFVVDHDEPLSVRLESLFVQTRDLPQAERQKHVQSFFEVVLQPDVPETWSEVEGALIPILRSHHYLGFSERGAPRLGIQAPFASPLAEFIAVRGENALYVPGSPELERWEVDAVEARARARDNLAKLAATDRWVEYDEGIWMLECEDRHHASRLVRTEFWSRLVESFEGKQPVAIAPSEDQVFAGMVEDLAAVRRLLEMASREFDAAPRPISHGLYAVTPGLTPFLLDSHYASAELDEALQRRGAEVIYGAYEAQAQLRETQDETSVPDAFVPRAMVLDTGKGLIASAMAMAGCDNLVPEVGQLIIVCVPMPKVVTDADGNPIGLADATDNTASSTHAFWWDEVREYFGERLVAEPGWEPARFRVTPSMAEELLRELEPARPVVST